MEWKSRSSYDPDPMTIVYDQVMLLGYNQRRWPEASELAASSGLTHGTRSVFCSAIIAEYMETRPMTRVVIADDHKLVRNALRSEIARETDMETVGECMTGDEVVDLVAQTQADVLLLDLSMPGMSALNVMRQLAAANRDTRVLVTTASGDAETIRAFLRNGALGYFVKNDDPADITVAIRSILAGKTWVSAAAAAALAEADSAPLDRSSEPISQREAQVLRLLARGATNGEIAQALNIAEGTVKNHISNLYQRLELHSRAEATAWAWKHGYVDKGDLPG